MKAGGMENS